MLKLQPLGTCFSVSMHPVFILKFKSKFLIIDVAGGEVPLIIYFFTNTGAFLAFLGALEGYRSQLLGTYSSVLMCPVFTSQLKWIQSKLDLTSVDSTNLHVTWSVFILKL